MTTHIKPDGDACGSLAAIVYCLQCIGKSVVPLFLTPVPPWYRYIIPQDSHILPQDSANTWLEGLGHLDLIILVDVNSLNQLSGIEPLFQEQNNRILVLDHHKTSDGLGTVELVDPSAPATGLIVLELIRKAGWPINRHTAEALFIAMATDTGWFQFANTTSALMRACAELVDLGIDPASIYARLYQQFTYPRFKLMLAMLNSLKLHFDGRLALLFIRQQDFQQTGTNYEDTENLINETYRLSTVLASVLLVELPDGRIRCSFRSRSPNHDPNMPVIDVSQIAADLGGGGHKNAAGAYMDGPIEKACEDLINRFAPYMKAI